MALSTLHPAKLTELRTLFPEPEELSSLFACFFRELPIRMATLHAGIERDTPELTETAANALKSSSACLGAWEVHQISARLESYSQNLRTEEAKTLAADLEKKIAAFEAELREAKLLQE